ncbi:MAG: 3-dehydroquinate synthase [uncultured Sphingomonadaceae bacterium]|uniref:3-dehydroquinate synthase n=1 Tax=uncultured Sphingomonadaceae bacterium TaxID=169976 RepID=A0A6J4SCG3_9SPHN|nr:MAG: 3-dehydroquinate synthase [uncultured Sphingomonadaceae bacterium]
MPTSFDVESSAGRYLVEIVPGLFERTLAEPGERVFIADAFLADAFRDAGLDAITIEADEHAKSLDRMTEVIVALRERRATRGTELVAVGGGVVQDVAAFAASVYMRGVAWTYVPTTLLSMTDSCIGGKSSINVGRYKNIVGTIHPPRAVLVDPALTLTLSAEQKAAGLCEAAKICLCRGPEVFDRYLALQPSVDADADRLAAIIDESLRAKKWFIEVDEFDRAERLLLNFGHTFGHALEAASGFAVSHGIAVGLGMNAALHLGELMGRDYGRAPQVARFRRHIAELVGTVDGLAAALSLVTVRALLYAFGSDKKHARDRFAVILVTEDGGVERSFLPRDDASAELIGRAYRCMLDEHLAAPAAAPALAAE